MKIKLFFYFNYYITFFEIFIVKEKSKMYQTSIDKFVFEKTKFHIFTIKILHNIILFPSLGTKICLFCKLIIEFQSAKKVK